MGVILVFDTHNENKFLLIIYVMLSGVVSLWSIIVNARPTNARFCYDNAVPFQQVIFHMYTKRNKLLY